MILLHRLPFYAIIIIMYCTLLKVNTYKLQKQETLSMKNLYVKKFNLRTSDFDCHKKILPSAVLDLFQTVAGEHAIALGCGFDALFEKNLLWVLVRTRFEVIKQPDM